MRLTLATMIVAGLAVSAPAFAQAGVTVGMQVVDTAGGPVGTVKALKGDNLLIQTDKLEALLPAKSFTVSNGKLLFGMTQAQLDAQIEQATASANAAIAAGATVKGTGGVQVGTIQSVADGKAVLTLQDGKKIAIPTEGLRGNPDGTVTVGYSAEQLAALVKGDPAAATASE